MSNNEILDYNRGYFAEAKEYLWEVYYQTKNTINDTANYERESSVDGSSPVPSYPEPPTLEQIFEYANKIKTFIQTI
jgi:hypothetical protein